MKKIALSVLISSFAIASVGYGAAFTRETSASHTHGPLAIEELSHGGGLDACGGHWDRKKGTYHYHRKRC